MPQLKKFCKIVRYLQQMDKSLYQVVEDLCLIGLFQMRNSPGTTFLYPADAGYRKKIIAAAYSDAPEKAVDMIKCLILKDHYPKAADFRGNVVNAKNQLLEVKSTEGNKVTLGSGHVLTVDAKFKPMGRFENMAVYSMSGKEPLPSAGKAAPRDAPRGSAGNGSGARASGGYHGGKDPNFTPEQLTDYLVKNDKDGFMKVNHIIYKYVRSGKGDAAALVNKGMGPTELCTYMRVMHGEDCGLDASDKAEIVKLYAELCNAGWMEQMKVGNHGNAQTLRQELINDERKGDLAESLRNNKQRQEEMKAGITSPQEFSAAVSAGYSDNEQFKRDMMSSLAVLYYTQMDSSDLETVIGMMKMAGGNMPADIAVLFSMYGPMLCTNLYNYVATGKDDREVVNSVYDGKAPDSPLSMKFHSVNALMRKAGKCNYTGGAGGVVGGAEGGNLASLFS